MHDTHYKQVQMFAEKTVEGEKKYLNLRWTVSYVTVMSKEDKAEA